MSFTVDRKSLEILSLWVSSLETEGVETIEMRKDLDHLSEPHSSPKTFLQELAFTKYKWEQIIRATETTDSILALSLPTTIN